MTVMKNIKMIRLVCGILILIGFFLPWLDMGEIMSEFAALAGGETSSTFSGYKLATAGIEMADQKSSPVLSLIPVLGILVALYPFNNQWFIYLGSILAIGIMLFAKSSPITFSTKGLFTNSKAKSPVPVATSSTSPFISLNPNLVAFFLQK